MINECNYFFFRINTTTECDSHCECVGTRYSPVCSEDGQMNFFSACHAGCDQFTVNRDGKKVKAGVNLQHFVWGDGGKRCIYPVVKG